MKAVIEPYTYSYTKVFTSLFAGRSGERVAIAEANQGKVGKLIPTDGFY
jgi:hypothetical protein